MLIDVTSAGRVSIPSPSTGVPDDVHSITTSASRTQASTLAAARARGSRCASDACCAASPASAGEYTRIVSQSRNPAVCRRCARPTAPAPTIARWRAPRGARQSTASAVVPAVRSTVSRPASHHISGRPVRIDISAVQAVTMGLPPVTT